MTEYILYLWSIKIMYPRVADGGSITVDQTLSAVRDHNSTR